MDHRSKIKVFSIYSRHLQALKTSFHMSGVRVILFKFLILAKRFKYTNMISAVILKRVIQ